MLRLACLALALCASVALVAGATEDYTLRWNYVNPTVVGNLAAEKTLFASWKARMHRAYASADEEDFRFSLFQNTLARIVKKNQKSFNYGLNKFADMDPSEWANMYLNKKVQSPKKQELLQQAVVRKPKNVNSIPSDGWDWRDHNAVSYVKDQGQCGSCWAFSVVETVESQWAIKKGAVGDDLSPQQIVDCDWGDGDQGCDGGDPFVAYSYVIKNGLMKDDDYPYYSGDSGVNGTCEYVASKVDARISNFTFATPPCWNGTCANQNDILLAQNIYAHGPAGIIVDASNWQDYTWGSFDDCNSDYADMDHGVQVVGFEGYHSSKAHHKGGNTAGTVDLWIVRNSWGEDWGDEGYITLVGSSSQQNTCGLSNEAIYVDL